MEHDRDRIFNLLETGRISADEAEMLINALGSTPETPATPAAAPSDLVPPPATSSSPPRSLQIRVHQPTGRKNINVTVPLSLIKFAARFIPNEAMYELADAGVDLDDVMHRVLSGDLETGEVLSAVASENGVPTHIEIRVV